MESKSSTAWGVCSKHCTEETAQSSTMLEAKLDLIKDDKCAKLGKSSGIYATYFVRN